MFYSFTANYPTELGMSDGEDEKLTASQLESGLREARGKEAEERQRIWDGGRQTPPSWPGAASACRSMRGARRAR